MKQLNPRSDKEAIKEGEFLENVSVQAHLDRTRYMRNMMNLTNFAIEIKNNKPSLSAIALAGGLGTELFLIKPERAVLLELNQKLINKAFNHALNIKFNLETSYCDITKLPLPFKNKEFDLVIINSAIEHIPDIYELVDEMKRIGHNLFIGSLPIGDPPRDHLHVWKWADRKDVLDFATKIKGELIGSYWAHYDILWRDLWA